MMTRKKLLAVFIVLAFTAAMIFADGLFYQSQVGSEAIDSSYTAQLGIPTENTAVTATTIPANAVLQAIGNSDYPVTPGDTFLLSYSEGKNLISLNLQADSNCKVSIQSVGVVNAAGMTYSEFKEYVENLISTYYNFSAPQLQLVSCGVFSVRVYGEVSYSQYVTAWGLTRLSDLAIYAMDTASTRAVEVTYRDGSTKSYDLYNALRNGSAEDNPLLSPGCEVRFQKASTIVSLNGAVARTGVYQPLDCETLYDLVQNYAGGLLSSADAQSIRISNYAGGAYSSRYLSLEDAKSYTPANGDVISAVYGSQNLPYVTISGAIVPDSSSDTISSTNRTMYSFLPGETVQQLLANISSMLTSTSDAGSAYILRDGSRISIEDKDIALEQGDTVVIPFSSQAITVTGYVKNPGTFEYVPGMTKDYYISLAGGFTDSASGKVKVSGGNAGDEIPAGATIKANNNNLTTTLTLTASVLAIVSTILTIVINGHTITTWF